MTMIETYVLDALSAILDVPCSMEMPEGSPERFVVLEKTGSSVLDYIRTATFAVQSFAPSLLKAAELNEQVKDAMDALALMPEISRVKLDSDYNFTDAKTKHYRYQAVYDITY